MGLFDINIIYGLFKDFGAGLTEFGIICFLLWKLMTNHLSHIGKDITEIKGDVKSLTKKYEDTHSKIEAQGERISKLEGQVGN